MIPGNDSLYANREVAYTMVGLQAAADRDFKAAKNYFQQSGDTASLEKLFETRK